MKYRVELNGKTYEIEAERLPSPAAPSIFGEAVPAPVSGTVSGVAVLPGERVARGQFLAVIESMQTESRVAAARDGTVLAVPVEKGTYVSAGSALIILQSEEAL